MGRKKVEKNPVRRERLIQLMERENVSQRQLASMTGLQQQNISKMVAKDNYQNVTEETARAIHMAFPKYRLDWLLGIDDYATRDEEALALYEEVTFNYSASNAAIKVLLRTIGIEFTNQYEGGPFSEMQKVGFDTVAQGEKKVPITYDEWNGLVQEIRDYAEYRFTKFINNSDWEIF